MTVRIDGGFGECSKAVRVAASAVRPEIPAPYATASSRSLPALLAGPKSGIPQVALAFNIEPGEDVSDAVAQFILLTWGSY
jgi:hypothetical protein